MNKILNWTFGACFRTLGRFLAIFIVFVLLLFVGSKLDIELPDWLAMKVNASFLPGWASSLPAPQNIAYYSCSSATSCSLQSNNVDYISSPVIDRAFVVNPSSWIIGANGYVIGSPVTTMKPGYLYSVDYYLCANVDVDPNFDLYSSAFENFSNGNVYSITRRTTIANFPIIDSDRTFNYCHVYSALIVPEDYHNWAYIRLKRKSSNISNVYMSTVAVDTKELGIYSETIKNLIDDSGYATAESVEQVQDSVNKVEQEIQQTNDTITDSTSPDVSGMTDLAGYLPPGPLDSVLNLPLSILNSLNNKLSSSCSPLSLTLPFVNSSLSIPCLSTIFNQIAGLNLLWESLGVIFGALIMYSYLTYLYNWVDDVTSLRHTKARLFGAKSDADNWGGVE